MISVLILTKNEERDLPGCLESVKWCDDIHVLDSYSTDNTISIAKKFGATVTCRTFDNWSSHQNWALQNIKFEHKWVFYLDADERVSDTLRKALTNIAESQNSYVAFEVQRRDFAWNGRWLKHAQISPYYIRFFRPEKVRYERLVNPVTIVSGSVGRLTGYLEHFPFSKGFQFWLQRHINYASMEAQMRLDEIGMGQKYSMITAIFSSDFTEKRRHQKGLFYKLPGRPVIKWLYMVCWRKAFLDGKAGLTYSTMQSIYEYFIILKTRELLKGIGKVD